MLMYKWVCPFPGGLAGLWSNTRVWWEVHRCLHWGEDLHCALECCIGGLRVFAKFCLSHSCITLCLNPLCVWRGAGQEAREISVLFHPYYSFLHVCCKLLAIWVWMFKLHDKCGELSCCLLGDSGSRAYQSAWNSVLVVFFFFFPQWGYTGIARPVHCLFLWFLACLKT